ncbi:MAG: site-specific DNA-methyltransferase [Selenomonadaceae bacterium]|nr:site-specific DNA-methyltransferase [Selenomonadaceae bacterium]
MEFIDPHLDPIILWNQKPKIESNFSEAVPIHNREIISPIRILNEVRDDTQYQTNLFGEEDVPRDRKQIDSYQHERGWKNRMIAGDSLAIMNSLLQRENMAGQVQMIYFDPPYGIRFGSNFQPFINKRDVKDRDEDLSHEMETIKAFRDTWERGIHSYLSYIYRRVSKARELLSDSGSLFFQIGDENVHRIRMVLDEVFGSQNFVCQICFRKKGMPLGASYLETMNDYILWYANDKKSLKYRQLFVEKDIQGDPIWRSIELPDGSRRPMTRDEFANLKSIPKNSRIFRYRTLYPAGVNENSIFPVIFNGKEITPPPGKSWKTHEEGMKRLIKANRVDIAPNGETLRYLQYFDDYPVAALTNFWNDTGGDTDKIYTVQTSKKVLRRCILMSTDPGDLVLDITCGSGTTAYVAEQFGRRWITCDTSRIAIEIAKERIATATFDWYKTADNKNNPRAGFQYKTVPHITLKSIANNQPPAEEILYDRPISDPKKIRVASEFKIESMPSPIVMSVDSAARGYGNEWMTFFSEQIATIDGRNGEKIELSNLMPIEEMSSFNATAETDRANLHGFYSEVQLKR